MRSTAVSPAVPSCCARAAAIRPAAAWSVSAAAAHRSRTAGSSSTGVRWTSARSCCREAECVRAWWSRSTVHVSRVATATFPSGCSCRCQRTPRPHRGPVSAVTSATVLGRPCAESGVGGSGSRPTPRCRPGTARAVGAGHVPVLSLDDVPRSTPALILSNLAPLQGVPGEPGQRPPHRPPGEPPTDRERLPPRVGDGQTATLNAGESPCVDGQEGTPGGVLPPDSPRGL